MDGYMDGWMNEQMDGWMDGWMDVKTSSSHHIQTPSSPCQGKGHDDSLISLTEAEAHVDIANIQTSSSHHIQSYSPHQKINHEVPWIFLTETEAEAPVGIALMINKYARPFPSSMSRL